MSAYVLDKAHIDFLVTAAIRINEGTVYGAISWCAPFVDERRQADERAANLIGAMLWTENKQSVAYRYQDNELERTRDSHDYEHAWSDFRPSRDALKVLKALACYEYQSCEHPDWSKSEAKRFCDALRNAAIHRIPGYEEAEGWAIHDPAPVEPEPEPKATEPASALDAVQRGKQCCKRLGPAWNRAYCARPHGHDGRCRRAARRVLGVAVQP